jgi:uncharacterized protein (TIGR02118 family)
MATSKLIVAYPPPKDIDAFEAIYDQEHVPIAVAKLEGKSKIVATKVLQSPQDTPRFSRIAEVHFPSMEVLQRCDGSAGAQETLANAAKIPLAGLRHQDCGRGYL